MRSANLERARQLLTAQLDRLLNPRVHMGELQPRRTPVPGILTSNSKALANVTPTTQFHAFFLHTQYGQGYIEGTSISTTTGFTCVSVAENTSFSSGSIDSLVLTAGTLSVMVGTPVESAGGFVTFGSIPNAFANTVDAATLDPGDLLNSPGATTMPLWDFLNNPRTGIYRKLTPAAESFYAPSAAPADGCAMIPFILFNIPSTLLSANVFSTQIFKSYDIYPQIVDSMIPGVEKQASEAEVVAAELAQQIVGSNVSGSYPYLASAAKAGAAGSLAMQLDANTVASFVGVLGTTLTALEAGRAFLNGARGGLRRDPLDIV